MTFEEVLHKYRGVYYKFPQSLKTFLGSIYGNVPLSVRFGKNFSLHDKALREFEAADEQFQLDFMYHKTLETLIFAQENIPYYKNIFQQHGVSSKDFKALEDIKLFPCLTKNDIKTNIENIHTNIREKPVAYYSGGSLSTPTKYFLPVSSRAKEKAYNNYIFSKNNYHYRNKALLSRGREVFRPRSNIFWEYEPVDNYFLLCSNYMNSDAFPLMYTKALKFKPKFFFGYPSAVISFIKQSKKHGYKKIDIEGVILASETVYPDELKMIQEYFSVDVLTHYGHTERNAIAYRINNEHYNFLNSYGVVRVVDEEIVTTSFDNLVMPFINYKTGDHAVGEIECFANSDIAKKVENIEGRTQDFLVSKDKRLVSITTLVSTTSTTQEGYLSLENIDAIQYIQNNLGKVTILVEGKNIDTDKVKNNMCKAVKNSIDFDIKVVNKIEKSSRGKRIICKQSLDIENIRKLHNSF